MGSIDLESAFVLMKESRIVDQYCFPSDSPAELTSLDQQASISLLGLASLCWFEAGFAGQKYIIHTNRNTDVNA